MITFGLTLVYSDISMQLLIYFVVDRPEPRDRLCAGASVHHAALFGIGAFTYAVITQQGWSNDLIVCGPVAAVIANPCQRDPGLRFPTDLGRLLHRRQLRLSGLHHQGAVQLDSRKRQHQR